MTTDGLEVTSQGLYGWTRESATPHWHLWADEKDDGPAALQVEHWRATAKLGEQHLVVERLKVHTNERIWETSAAEKGE